MDGSIVRRIIEKIKAGRVVSFPLTNTVIRNSSKDSANVRMAAPTMVGRRMGIVTRQNALAGVAPRSRAASSRLWSNRRPATAWLRRRTDRWTAHGRWPRLQATVAGRSGKRKWPARYQGKGQADLWAPCSDIRGKHGSVSPYGSWQVR